MKVNYIIPTLGRETITRTIESIINEDLNANILVRSVGTASQNRNKALKEMPNSDWVGFIDDDDFYSSGYLSELDNEFDIVVVRMNQYGGFIPRYENESLVYGNVGINFFIKTDFYNKNFFLFDDLGHGEDWRFIEQHLKFNPKIKVTKDVYYNAPTRGNNQIN